MQPSKRASPVKRGSYVAVVCAGPGQRIATERMHTTLPAMKSHKIMHSGTYRYISASGHRDEELGVDRRETDVGLVVK